MRNFAAFPEATTYVSTPSSQLPTRSTFVTVVGWIFVAGSGFGILIAILQAAMLLFLFPHDMLEQMTRDPEFQKAPPVMRFMAEHMFQFFLLIWSLIVVTFACSIGLLRRQNWARVCFIGLMVFGIVWQLAGLVLQNLLMSSMMQIPTSPNAPDEVMGTIGTMMIVMRAITALMGVAMCVLFGWIANRLMSAPIRAEFGVS